MVALPADQCHLTAVLTEARLLLTDVQRPRIAGRLTVGQCRPMADRVRQIHRMEAAEAGHLHTVRRVPAAASAADRLEGLAAAAGLAVEAAAEAMSHPAEAVAATSHPAAVAEATVVTLTVGVTKLGFLAGNKRRLQGGVLIFAISSNPFTNLGASGFHELVTHWFMIASHYLGNDATQSTHSFSSLYHSCFRIALAFGD